MGEKSYCRLKYKAVSEQNINKKIPKSIYGEAGCISFSPLLESSACIRVLAEPFMGQSACSDRHAVSEGCIGA